MIGLRKLPIRLRLTLAFAAAMALPLTGIAVVMYLRIGSALLEEIDTGLSARAEALRTNVVGGLSLTAPQRSLIESREAFAQVVNADGKVLESTAEHADPLLAARAIRGLVRPTFIERRGEGNDETARLLAVPVTDRSTRLVIIVGASMQDRADTLRELAAFFAVGGPLALLLASTAGWIVTGHAFRPVERIRKQASAISASELSRRLTVPAGSDEIHRLAETLNAMLARLEDSTQRERRFLDDASHELRTPLTALKAELDLARARPRNHEELSAALASASEEADRLARMAEDLLVISRAHGGHLPVHREETSLPDVVAAASKLFGARAATAGIRIEVDVPQVRVFVDGMRVRQAIDNLLDNALRYTPAGSAILVRADVHDGTVRIVIEDEGPGFPAGYEERAFEPFNRAVPGDADRGQQRSERVGLGLAIVRAIAQGHGGSVMAENRAEGGARVTVTMRHAV